MILPMSIISGTPDHTNGWSMQRAEAVIEFQISARFNASSLVHEMKRVCASITPSAKYKIYNYLS